VLRIGITFDADPEPDPDPTFHLDANTDPSFQIKGQNLDHTLYLIISKLMQIQIQLITLKRILLFHFLRIHVDPDTDLQHWP
jgi:hypothetical protein